MRNVWWTNAWDLMAKINLKDAYTVVPLHRCSSRPSLSFEHRGVVYHTSLPFPMSVAPRVFSKLMRYALELLSNVGIALAYYRDDLGFCIFPGMPSRVTASYLLRNFNSWILLSIGLRVFSIQYQYKDTSGFYSIQSRWWSKYRHERLPSWDNVYDTFMPMGSHHHLVMKNQFHRISKLRVFQAKTKKWKRSLKTQRKPAKKRHGNKSTRQGVL